MRARALMVAAALAAGTLAASDCSQFKANVMDFGAKGDGVHDDTPAIQAAIDAVAARGAGVVYFPWAKGGYRLASPAPETVDGKPCRSQLHVPPRPLNIGFEGEMPCSLLHPYVFGPTSASGDRRRFGTQHRVNVVLISDWKPPLETNATARPWSMLSVLPGWKSRNYPLNDAIVSIRNLEFRAYLDKDLMCAVQSCVNLQDAAEAVVRSSQFALNDQLGDIVLKKELQESPCPAAGLIMSNGLNDQQIIHGVNVQGFKYGIVMAEHTHATYLYLHNNEYALTFSESAYVSAIDFVTAQHNRCILHVPNNGLYGRGCGPDVRSAVQVDLTGLSVEDGKGTWPKVSQLKWGVYDPNDRLRGVVEYRVLDFGYPWRPTFPVVGARRLKVVDFETGDVTARH